MADLFIFCFVWPCYDIRYGIDILNKLCVHVYVTIASLLTLLLKHLTILKVHPIVYMFNRSLLTTARSTTH